jgi:hypothetical protein
MQIKIDKLRIPLWVSIVVWFLYSQLVAYGMSSGYILDTGYFLWEVFGQFIPSITRLVEPTSQPYKLLATVMLVSMPLLFIVLLFVDVEEGIKGVRIKKTEVKAATILCIVGSSIFIAGFGSRSFRGSYLIFSMGAAFLTYISAYSYRTAYCIIFQSPRQEAAERLHF